MTKAAFDTLKLMQKLKTGGMPEKQAIAVTEAINEAFMERTAYMRTAVANVIDFKQKMKKE
jgi:hypothetical protein